MTLTEAVIDLVKVLGDIPAHVVKGAEPGSCHGADVSPKDHARIVAARHKVLEALRCDYTALREIA